MKYTLKPLDQLLTMTQQGVEDAMAPLRVIKARSQATVMIAELDEEIIRANTEIQELALRKDIDINRMADKIDELELLELRKTRISDIIAQLFPVPAAA